jgi:hypothetical protein
MSGRRMDHPDICDIEDELGRLDAALAALEE